MEFLENRYLQIRERFLVVSEGKTPGYMTEKMVALPERLVKCVWYDQLLEKSRLKTADGRRVKVFSPGEWNLGPGPDFQSASYQVEGSDPEYGDVEIHVRATGWKSHGHHSDPEYNGVGMHVVMWNDTQSGTIVKENGEETPHLAMASCLEKDLNELAASIDMENYPYNSDSRIGLCMKEAEESPGRAKQLLEMAGRERLFLKARRFSSELSKKKFEEVLYAGFMEGLGYRRNKKPFRRLAGAVPLKLARKVRRVTPPLDRAAALEAVYLGA